MIAGLVDVAVWGALAVGYGVGRLLLADRRARRAARQLGVPC